MEIIPIYTIGYTASIDIDSELFDPRLDYVAKRIYYLKSIFSPNKNAALLF